MRKTILLILLILSIILLTSIANADTWFNDSFEDNDCSNWQNCAIGATGAYAFNGSYTAKSTGGGNDFTSPAWMNFDSNFNYTFWVNFSQPGAGNYKIFGLIKSGAAWDTGYTLVFNPDGAACPFNDVFCDYTGGAYSSTGIAVPYGVKTRITLEFNNSLANGLYNIYLNGSTPGENVLRKVNAVARGGAIARTSVNSSLIKYALNGEYTDDHTVYNKTTLGESIPMGNSVNITFNSNPLNYSQFNIMNISFNATVNATNDFVASLVINGTLNASRTFLAGSEVFVSFNVTMPERDFIYYINVTDSTNNNRSVTTNTTFFVDYTVPVIDAYKRANNQISFGNSFIFGQFNITDDHVWGVNLTIDDTYTVFNKTNITGSSYTINYNFNPQDYGLTPGVHILNLFVSDSHTTLDIPSYAYDKNIVDKSITYQFGKEWISVKPENKLILTDFNTYKLRDRYTFELNRDFLSRTIYGDDIIFLVESSSKLDVVTNSEYPGHIVSFGLEKWIDFNTNDEKAVVSIDRINERSLRVTVKGLKDDKITFNSLGGLNVVQQNYTFYYGNLTETYINQTLETDNTAFSLYCQVHSISQGS